MVKCHLILFVSLCGLGSFALKPSDPVVVNDSVLAHVLTFREIAGLSPTRQVAYIQGLQDIVISYADFLGDEREDAYVMDFRTPQPLTLERWITWLEGLSTTAWARGYMPTSDDPDDEYYGRVERQDRFDVHGTSYPKCFNDDLEAFPVNFSDSSKTERFVCQKSNWISGEECPTPPFTLIKIGNTNFCVTQHSVQDIEKDGKVTEEQKKRLQTVPYIAASPEPSRPSSDKTIRSGPPNAPENISKDPTSLQNSARTSALTSARTLVLLPSSKLSPCTPHFSCRMKENGKSVNAKERFFGDRKNQDCIYAGNNSTINWDRKKCSAVRAFSADPRLRCTEKRAPILCNPLIFGTDAVHPDQPLCIPAKHDATLQCQIAGGQKSAANAIAFLNKNQSNKKVEQAWNQFAASINTLCTQRTASSAYHCKECETILQRVATLNAQVMDIKSCGQVPGWDQIQRKIAPSAPKSSATGQ